MTTHDEDVVDEPDEEFVEDDWTPRVDPDDWVETMREKGEDWKQFDPRYVCLRQGRYLDPDRRAVYAKKSTLGQIERIEAARWKILLKLSRIWSRRAALTKEVFEAGGECFIPTEAPPVVPIKNRALRPEDRPPRVEVEPSNYFNSDGYSSRYDDDFYEFRPTKHNGTEMEVIAAAAEEGEWEQIILPDRLVRASDPAKLDLGRRWRHLEVRERSILERSGIIHELLKVAVELTGILPRGTPHLDKDVLVEINGRKYTFTVTGGDYVKVDMRKWPHPSDPPHVKVTGPFKLDESLIGKLPDAVRCRLGEPALVDTDGLTWRYSTGTVTFKKGYFGTVVKVDQTPNDIPSLAPRPPQAGRKRGRVEGSAQGPTDSRGQSKTRSGRRQGVDGEVRSKRKAARSRSRTPRQAT